MYWLANRLIPIIFGVATVCMCCSADEYAPPYDLSSNGSVNYWMLLLPIPNPPDGSSTERALTAIKTDLLAEGGGEADIIPSVDTVQRDGLKWCPRSCSGHVNLWVYSPIKDDVTAYAFCYLNSDSDKDAVLKIGNSDPILVYLNGQKVYENLEQRAPAFGQGSTSVRLNKGLNRLMVKTSQAKYEWGFMLQVVDSSDRPISGVNIVLPISRNDIKGDPGVYPVQTGDALPEVKHPSFVTVAIDDRFEIMLSRAVKITPPIKSALEKMENRIVGLDHVSVSSADASDAPDLIIDYISNADKYQLGWKPSMSALAKPESYAVINQNGRIYLFGNCDMGIVYGISFIQSRLWNDNDSLRIHLDNSISEYEPDFRKRAIYVMYGYNYPGIEVHDWSLNDWKSYIDELILAHLNFLYVYIWTDTWGYVPGTAGYNSYNRKIHETLRSVIKYAHNRGLKVCYMITPCLLPNDLYDKEPSVLSKKPFVKGWRFACTETPIARRLMNKMIRAELEYMREADAFQVVFFDPGGCSCDLCMKDMVSTIFNQIAVWLPIVKEYNRNSDISLNFWPFKVIENEYKIEFAEQALKRAWNTFGPFVDICEAPDLSRVYLHTAKRMGFPTTAFIFPTNPETSYLLPIIAGDLWKPMLKQIHDEWGFDSALFQRMEAKTRGAQDWLIGNLYYNNDEDLDTLTYVYACSLIGNSEDGGSFAQILKAIDEFTNTMQESGSPNKLFLGFAIDNALKTIGSHLPENKRWYEETGSLYRYLGMGIYAKNQHDITVNPGWKDEYERAKQGFIQSFKSGALYGRAVQDENVIGGLFDQYVEYLSIGRYHTLF